MRAQILDLKSNRRKSWTDGEGYAYLRVMVEAIQADMPFVNGIRVKSRWAKIWENFQEFKALTEKHGALVPAPVAAKVAGVHRSRIFQLIEAKAVEAVMFQGHAYLTEDSFIKWAKSERKAGRPVKLAVLAEKKGDVRAALAIAFEK